MPTVDINDIETKALDGLKSIQDSVLDLTKKAVDSVAPRVPKLDLPFVDQLPEATKVVDNAFEFAGSVLEANRTFVKSILEALTPLVTEETAPAPAPVATKPTSKPKSTAA